MTVIAQLVNSDASSDVDLSGIIGLREAPFPGDGITRLDGTQLLVTRRTFNELTDKPNAGIDVILAVRISK